MKIWKIIFLFKQVIFTFHVNFPGCVLIWNRGENTMEMTWYISYTWRHLAPSAYKASSKKIQEERNQTMKDQY